MNFFSENLLIKLSNRKRFIKRTGKSTTAKSWLYYT